MDPGLLWRWAGSCLSCSRCPARGCWSASATTGSLASPGRPFRGRRCLPGAVGVAFAILPSPA